MLMNSSLLLQAIVASDNSPGIRLGFGDFERFGTLIITQLAELRHRERFLLYPRRSLLVVCIVREVRI